MRCGTMLKAVLAGTCAALPVIILAGGVSADTLGVPTPYSSIQQAINAAAEGDVISIAAATYKERLYIINRSDLTLRGSIGAATSIRSSAGDGDLPAFYVENSTGIRIENVQIEGGETGLVVTGDSQVELDSTVIRNVSNVGAFIGAIGCAPLPPGSLSVPDCFLADREAYFDTSRLDISGSTVSDNGVAGVSGTGLVYFPGTSGVITASDINRNQLTGLFAWGARVDMDGCRLDQNVEHALEYRQYPSPKLKKGFFVRAGGTLAGNIIQRTLPLPGNYLGGGMVLQAADMVLIGNDISDNATWGISACRQTELTLSGNTITGNGEAGLIIQKKTRAVLQGDDLFEDNGYEGVVAQGRSYLDMSGATVRDNGRFGVLLQKKSEGHLAQSLVSGNGASGSDYGGVGFIGKSSGSVTGCEVTGHANGYGVSYYGGPNEVFVEDNLITRNTKAGVVFEGDDAYGTVVRNTFSGNQPYDVWCPGGGLPWFGGQQPGAIDAACADAPDQFVTVPAATSLTLSSLERVGPARKFAALLSSSLPVAVGRSLAGVDGTADLAASPDVSKQWDLTGGTTSGGADTRIALFNTSLAATATVTITLYPEGSSPVTIGRKIRPKKRKVVSAATVLGSGRTFTAHVSADTKLAVEQQVVDLFDQAAAVGTADASLTWFFARGEVSDEARTTVSLRNPGETTANVRLTCGFGPGDSRVFSRCLAGGAGTTLSLNDELAPRQGVFFVTVESDQPVAASLGLTAPGGTLGDDGSPKASDSWFLPHGSTDGCETFIDLANPGDEDVSGTVDIHTGDPLGDVTVRFSLSAGESVSIPAYDHVQGLDFGASVTAAGPVIAGARLSHPDGQLSGGTSAAEAGNRFYVADGTTGDTTQDDTLFQLYNPNGDTVTVRLIYRFSKK